MITPPRRSVTRFFIPMIDVLILLFCIFLLMPFVSAPAQPETSTKDETKDAKAAPPPTDVEKLREERDEAIRRLERFRKEQVGRLQFRSLDVDPTTGLLVDTVGGEKRLMPLSLVRSRRENRTPTPEEAAAAAEEMKEWVKLQKRRAAEQEKEAFFVLRLPKTPSGHPTEGDLRNYQAWFENPSQYGYELP
jgi:hypothetical protein